MNILMTGANGFIGKALTEYLSHQHKVYALSRSHDNKLVSNNVVYLEQDFKKPLDSKSLPKKIDTIIHLAQSSQYRSFPEGMKDMVAVNLLGLTEVLDYAKTAECQHFINFSSGSVYDPSKSDQSEGALVNPKAAYPLTKLVSEKFVDLYQDYFKVLNVRLFFPYGPGQEGMLVPNLINSVKKGNPIGLQGSEGGLEICPIYIDDVIKVCDILINTQTQGILNVAGVEQLRLKEIGEQIGNTLGRSPTFTVNQEVEPPLFRPSLEKMRKLLRNHEFISFQEGTKKMI